LTRDYPLIFQLPAPGTHIIDGVSGCLY